MPVRKAQRRWRWWWPTPSEQDQQAHLSNDVLAHWFLWSAFSDAAHTNKSPARGTGLSLVMCLAIQGLPIPPERKPTTPTPSRTVGCTKSPARERG